MTSPRVPDSIRIFMATRKRLSEPEELGRVLATLEAAEGLQPTNWGADERARESYDREAMLAQVKELVKKPGGEFLTPGLARRKPIKWESFLSFPTKSLSALRLDFKSGLKDADLPRVFQLGDELAAALAVDYGQVHLRFEENETLYNAVANFSAKDLQRHGPIGPAVRTWFGPHMVSLVGGRDEIRAAAPAARDTPWGAIQFDLADPPWSATPSDLQAAQRSTAAHLKASGIWADVPNNLDVNPGPGWKPIPLS